MSHSLSRPSIRSLPDPLRAATIEVAERLRGAGHRAWLVGGSVRDLALEIEPHDADLASAALPDEVEALFERTLEVGKRFVTILVHVQGIEVQVTTFRTEDGYSDGRRPDSVSYGTSLEEDAGRRDFTCNAVYLDPLTDEVRDPEGGLADLEAGVLRCVGDPARRFGEDGLRLLRMARFAARYDLEVEGHTLTAARENARVLEGVSRERIRAELEGLAAGPHPASGLALLAAAGVWEHALPLPAAGATATVEAVARLGPRPGLAALLAVLLFPGDPAALHGLRPSRGLEREVGGLWQLAADLGRRLGEGPAVRRSALIRLLRDPLWPAAARVFEACAPEARRLADQLEGLRELDRSLTDQDKHPTLFLTSKDLAAAGIESGPLWGTLLREAEDLQLDGEHVSREAALAWLRGRKTTTGDTGNHGART